MKAKASIVSQAKVSKDKQSKDKKDQAAFAHSSYLSWLNVKALVATSKNEKALVSMIVKALRRFVFSSRAIMSAVPQPRHNLVSGTS